MQLQLLISVVALQWDIWRSLHATISRTIPWQKPDERKDAEPGTTIIFRYHVSDVAIGGE